MENREKFFARLREAPASALFSSEDVARIEMAYDLAKYAHRAQGRKDGERYFEHPRRVALWLIDGLELYDLPAMIAALLHDAYEDCPQYVAPEKARILGGVEAERMLRLLSKVPKEGYVDRLRRHADWKTLAIKLCDRYDNISSLDALPVEFQRKQIDETRDIYLPLFDHLQAVAPPSHRDTVRNLALRLECSVVKWAEALGLKFPPQALE